MSVMARLEVKSELGGGAERALIGCVKAGAKECSGKVVGHDISTLRVKMRVTLLTLLGLRCRLNKLKSTGQAEYLSLWFNSRFPTFFGVNILLHS